MVTVDLALLPKIDHACAWFRLDDAVANRIKPLLRSSERIQNSVKFMQFSDADDKTLFCADHEAKRLREGFLRAALAELVSVEEILKLDLRDLGRSEKILRLNDTPLPHLHLVRELRNHELHVHHNRLTGFSRDLLWGNISKPEDARPLTVGFWILENITPASFSKLHNAKRYSANQIQTMVKWFNDTQSEWGVHQILLKAASEYAEALANQYF